MLSPARWCAPVIMRTSRPKRLLLQLLPNQIQNQLPDSASILPHHGCIRLAVVGLLKLRHVGDHAIYAPFSWRVWVHGNQHARQSFGAILAPAVGPSQKEALLRGKPVNCGGFLTGQCTEKRHISDA